MSLKGHDDIVTFGERKSSTPRLLYRHIVRMQKLKSVGYTEPSEVQEKPLRVLSEMSVRLQTIEHRMEVLHMQPPPVTKQSPPAE